MGVIIIALGIVIFFLPSYGWNLHEWLSPSATSNADDQNLAAANDALKAQLATLQMVAAQLPSQPTGTIRAIVYSQYPFNFKNELLVNAGTNQGVVSGTAVVFQGLLVGRVEKAYASTAVVQTIFDNNFKMPVRVASSGYDGLLQGGSDPAVISIARDTAINSGDSVYSAAPGIPYGLPIGTVSATSTSPDSLFEQAAITLPYDINSVKSVFILQQQ